MTAGLKSGLKKSGALFAPLFFMAASLFAGNPAFPQASATTGQGGGGNGFGIEISALTLMFDPKLFEDPAIALGFANPVNGSLILPSAGLAGGRGAIQVSGWVASGQMSAVSGARESMLGMDVAGVSLLQRYPYGSWSLISGFLALVSNLSYELRDSGNLTRYDGRGYGGGMTLGAQWPDDTNFRVFAEGGYIWLGSQGTWRGPLAPLIARNYFGLNMPIARAGVQVLF